MDVSTEHIEIVQAAGGPKPRIKGTRIRVEDVVSWYHQQGTSVDVIVETFPHISRADVFAALAYYWDTKEALDRKWDEDAAWVEEYQRTIVDPLEETQERRHVG